MELMSALIGAIVGGLVAFLATLYAIRKQEKYKVFAELVAAFAELLRLLEIKHPNHSNEYKPVLILLQDNYAKYFQLIIRSSMMLNQQNKELRLKFNQLYCVDLEHNYPTLIDYQTENDHNKEIDARKLAIQRIESLLKIANPD